MCYCPQPSYTATPSATEGSEPSITPSATWTGACYLYLNIHYGPVNYACCTATLPFFFLSFYSPLYATLLALIVLGSAGSNTRTPSGTASNTQTPTRTRSSTATPSGTLSPGGSPSATPTIAPLYYLGAPYESCTLTCSNLGLSCSAYPAYTSNADVIALFASLGQTCATVNTGWYQRPHISGEWD